MSVARFNLGGIARIKVEIAKIPRNKDKFVKDTLQDFQELLLKFIDEKAPRKTGDYAKSWKKGKLRMNVTTVETPQGELFEILEFQGRRPGRIEKKVAEVLHFLVSGQDVFVRFVDHPGFDEIPHVRPSMRKVIKDGNRIVFKNLKKNVPMFR